MNRGVNHQSIFSEEMDYEYFLEILRKTKELYPFEIHAYCLMTNHYHLLIETKDDEIWKIMKMINLFYVRYYNTKYQRDGTLFRGRYKSCCINNDTYFLQTSRYICLNPVKAKMVERAEQYRWSSFRTLIGLEDDHITKTDKTLHFLGDCEKTFQNFVESDLTVTEEYEKIRLDIGEQ